MKTGELDNYKYRRWCEKCNQFHGILYSCKYYPKNINKKISQDSIKFKKDLLNDEWCNKKGLPNQIRAIFKFFAGLY